MENALSFAQQAAAWSDAAPGEIVYTGPQLAAESDGTHPVNGLRILPVGANRENTGIRSLSVQQVLDEPDSLDGRLWCVKNYGQTAQTVRAGYAATAGHVVCAAPGNYCAAIGIVLGNMISQPTMPET